MLKHRLLNIAIAGFIGLIFVLGFVLLAARPETATAAGVGEFRGIKSDTHPKALLSAAQIIDTQVCSSPWLLIPDNDPAGVTDAIVLENLGTITDLDVSLNLYHTWVGDLLVELEHVNTGTTATLVNRPGFPASTWGCSGDNIDVTVNDQGPDVAIENQCNSWPPAIHGDAPGGDPSASVLAAFNGENTAGTWVLTVADMSQNDTGELMDWCLNISAIFEPDIVVSPSALSSIQEVNTQVTQSLTISNVGNADLTWTITEEGGIPAMPVLNAPVPEYVAGNTPDTAGPAPLDGVPTAPLVEGRFPNPLSGPAYGWNWNHGQFYTAFDLSTPQVLPRTAEFPVPSDFIGAGEVMDGSVWMIDFWEKLYQLDPNTGQVLSTKTLIAPLSGNYSGMALDPTSGVVYLSSTSVGTSNLYTIDLVTGSITHINSIALGPGIIAIAIDGTGTLYGVDIVKDALLEIDKVTGTTILVGHLGFNANYGQGMAWDPVTDTLFMAAYNGSTFRGELRIADRTNGLATFIAYLGDTSPGGQNQLGWVAVDLLVAGCEPADIPWLSLDPTSGTTVSATSSLVEVTYDSTGLAPDVYTGTLCIASNDPDTPLVRVPVTLTVTEVMTPTPNIVLTKTVGLNPAVCAAGDNIIVNQGQDVTYCYTAQNTGDVTLTLHDLSDSDLGTIFTGLPYTLTPGASVQVTQTFTPLTTTVNVGTWVACNLTSGSGGGGCSNPDATDVVTATDVATVTVVIPVPAIMITKTVDVVPTGCGSESAIEVLTGTDVTYCYQVLNTGDVTLTVHDLEDSELGTLLSGLTFTLPPGSTGLVTATTTIFTDTVNVATWTACNPQVDGLGCSVGATQVVSATDAATVTIRLPEPAIILTKTVGLNPAVCAEGEILTVPQGTAVTFCYRVTNTGDITLGVHDLEDNDLGIIFANLQYNLVPGANVFVTHTERIFTDTVNAAIWTACNEPVEGLGCSLTSPDYTTAIDAATVIVTEGIPDIELSPTALSATTPSGTSSIQILTISNVGLGYLDWDIVEEVPQAAVLLPLGEQPPFVAGNAADSAGPAPLDGVPTTLPEPAGYNPLGSTPAYGWNWNHGQYYTAWDLATPNILPNTAPFPAPGDFIGAGEFVDGKVYMIDFRENLYELDPATGAVLSTKLVTQPLPGQNYSGMALDPTSGVVYLTSTSVGKSHLYTLDLATGVATSIGPVYLGPGIIAIAIDGTGTIYAADIIKNSLLTLDKATAAASLVGHLGFDANFGQGMAWNPATDTLFMAAYNGATYRGELRYVDRTTGYATYIAQLGSTDPGGQNQLGWTAVDLGQDCVAGDIPWINVNPTAGTSPAGDGVPVQVTFNAGLLDPGVYSGAICVNSNDPDEPQLRVPLTFTVTGGTEQQFGQIYLPKLLNSTQDGESTARIPERLLIQSTPFAVLAIWLLGKSLRKHREEDAPSS